MNTMSHRGYTARVEFDERENNFVGRVLGTRTIIGFHGETVAQLRAEFEAAIDDSLRDCKEQGVKPERPASGKMLLRVPPDIHGAALVAAQAAGKSLNQWATELLDDAVTRRAVPARAASKSGFGMVKVSGPATSPDVDVASLLER